jgi:hypothetical protein
MTHTTSDKIQLTTYPGLPSTCAVCNRSSDGQIKFLDFQCDLEYYGSIVVCEDCWKSGVDALGFVPVAAVNEAQLEARILEETLVAVREENEGLKSALDNLLRVRPDLAPTDSGAADSSEPSEEVLFGVADPDSDG